MRYTPRESATASLHSRDPEQPMLRVLLFNVHLCDVQLHYSKTTAFANVWICIFHVQIITQNKSVPLSHHKNSSWPMYVNGVGIKIMND